jgi:hypothetical protein
MKKGAFGRGRNRRVVRLGAGKEKRKRRRAR